MHCRSCELLTEDELGKVPGVEKVKTNFRTGKAEIFYSQREPSQHALTQAVRRAGYEIGEGKRPWIARDIQPWVEILFAVGILLALFLWAKAFGVLELSFGSSERLASLPFVLLLGLAAGFSTCMAIVGGLVLAVSARFSEMHPEASPRKKFLPHVYFNLGRIGGFTAFGALLGYLGSTFQLSSLSVGALTALVGGVMLLVGFQLLELFPRLSAWKLTLPKSLSRLLGVRNHSEKEYRHSRTAFLGAATFFLPCGFTQLTQLFVVTQGSPLLGALTMGTFALGTAPGLLGIGGIAAAAKGWFRSFFFKLAGLAVIGLGLFNLQNGNALIQLGPEGEPQAENAGEGKAQKNAQVVRITQKGNGYFPAQVNVKKGKPVRLIVDSQESYSCAVSFVIPKLGVRKILKPGENIFDFTPEQAGTIPFSCSMGMYRGVITVTN